MRWLNRIAISVLCVLVAAESFADVPSQPVAASAYIALPKRVGTEPMKPLKLPMASARFIALSPRNFKSVMHTSHTAPAAPGEDVTTTAAPARIATRPLVKDEQAQQIISIFAPDQ